MLLGKVGPYSGILLLNLLILIPHSLRHQCLLIPHITTTAIYLASMVSYDWHKPIPPACYPRLILENKQPAWGVLKTICYDPCTRDRYFVKHYRKEVEYRARREDLGLTLCGSYGASTPGHLLIYDKCIPVLIQRLIPFTKTVGDIYREHPDK